MFRNYTLNGETSLSGSSSGHTFLSKSVLLYLTALVVILFGTLVRKKKIIKLAGLFEFRSASKSTGIQSVSTWTILKGLLIHKIDFEIITETIIAKYDGVFKVNLFGLYSFVFIANPTMLQKIYMSTEQGHLIKPEWYNKFMVGILEDGLVCSRPDTWKIHRSILSKAFAYNGLLRQLNIIEKHAKRLILDLQESQLITPCLRKSTPPFDKQVYWLTYEIILHIAAGNETGGVTEAENDQFRHNFNRVQDLVNYRLHHIHTLMDSMWNWNPKKLEMDRRLEDLRTYLNKILEEIRKQFDADTSKNLQTDDDMAGKSLVELMIKAGFSNDEVFTEMATFLAAGHETVSKATNMLMFLLASHKEYQDKCREEIDQMFDKMFESNTNEIPLEALNSLTFLDMCVKEGLRLHPVIPAIGRKLESQIQLDENTFLPPDTIVVVSPWVLHRNPKLYPEPEKFNPERFSPENKKNRSLCEYMPFGAGPRNCIGFKSSVIEIKVLAAYILRNFEVRSELSTDDLNQALRKTLWPFPDLGVTIHSRH